MQITNRLNILDNLSQYNLNQEEQEVFSSVTRHLQYGCVSTQVPMLALDAEYIDLLKKMNMKELFEKNIIVSIQSKRLIKDYKLYKNNQFVYLSPDYVAKNINLLYDLFKEGDARNGYREKTVSDKKNFIELMLRKVSLIPQYCSELKSLLEHQLLESKPNSLNVIRN